jgi:hypothetical protein
MGEKKEMKKRKSTGRDEKKEGWEEETDAK